MTVNNKYALLDVVKQIARSYLAYQSECKIDGYKPETEAQIIAEKTVEMILEVEKKYQDKE